MPKRRSMSEGEARAYAEARELIAQACERGWHELTLNIGQLSRIPDSIGELTQLSELSITSGLFLTALPESLGNLTQLTKLSIDCYHLSLVPESLGNLAQLTKLSIVSGLTLTALPESLGDLIQLSELTISGFRLTALPESLGNLAQLTKLSIEGSSLSALPESLGNLTQLSELTISGFGLTALPESLGNLVQLTKLSIEGNNLTALPQSLGKLTQLSELTIKGSKLRALPESLGNLAQLTKLTIEGNNLRALPESLGNLAQLTKLTIEGNNLNMLPQSLGNLTQLSELTIEGGNLRVLPETLDNLTQLSSLSISGGRLTTLPHWVLQNPQLTKLCITQNYLSTLPESIGQLSQLSEFDVHNNNLISLPESLGQLSQLKELDVSHNGLHNLPESLGELPELEKLEVGNNPLTSFPAGIRHQSGNIILAYLRKQAAERKRFVREAKLIIVGEAGVGKTSLARKLRSPETKLNPAEPSTHGINVTQWKPPGQAEAPLRLNIWDFGGQYIYHAMHRFFFSCNALYVFVTDYRTQQSDVYYWLNAIYTYGGADCPVVIVANEKQDHPHDLSESRLRKDYPQVKLLHIVNLETDRGVEDLRTALYRHAAALPLIGRELHASWLSVHAELENLPDPYISLAAFEDLCAEYLVAEVDIPALTAYLHEQGACLHIQDDDVLERILFLKPQWATDAVYAVVNDATIRAQGGRFTAEDLQRIWTKEYRRVRPELRRLMEYFRLCYQVGEREYILPQSLPDMAEALPAACTLPAGDTLQLRYTYPVFMPRGLLARLIVILHQDIAHDCEGGACVWRNIVVLQQHTEGDMPTYAELQEDYEKGLITLRVTGPQAQFLRDKIRDTLRSLHGETPNLVYRELIACTCSICQASQTPEFYGYTMVRRFQDAGKHIQCRKSYELVSVDEVLAGATLQQHSGGIPRDLLNRLHATLVKCDALRHDDALRALFIEESLYPWRNRVQEATSIEQRVTLCLQLYEEWHAKGENVLVALLLALRDGIEPGDQLHKDLDELATAVASTCRRP